MLLKLKVESEIKSLILKRFTRRDIIKEITKKYGQVQELLIWYDCCYNTICRELGINRKKGEELKPKRIEPEEKQGK